jgi:hypothetical protein
MKSNSQLIKYYRMKLKTNETFTKETRKKIQIKRIWAKLKKMTKWD